MSDYSDISSDDEMNEFHRAPRVFHERGNPMIDLNDRQFKMRYRLEKHTVENLERRIRPVLLKPTRRNKPLSPMHMLLLTLRFFATGTFQLVIGDLLKVDAATACRAIHRVANLIAAMKPEYIKMPAREEVRSNMVEFYNTSRFPGVLGAIDCSHIPIASPGGDNAELYRNRHGWFSLNVQVICDAKLRCLNIVARWPGSAHDSNIFANSRVHAQFETGEIAEGLLLGDSGYRCCRFLLTPVLREETDAQRAYNRAHKRARSAIERTFGVVKRRFPCLSMGLRVKLGRIPVIIVAAFVLHNIAIEAMDEVPEREEAALAAGRAYEELQLAVINEGDRRDNTAVRTAIINNVFG